MAEGFLDFSMLMFNKGIFIYNVATMELQMHIITGTIITETLSNVEAAKLVHQL